MKSIKTIGFSLLLLCIMTSFSQCSSAQKLQEKAPTPFGDTYCQSWVAGVQGGGSGINVFIPLQNNLPEAIALDSVYFRGKVAKLETKPQNQLLYIGRFAKEANQKEDLVMSSEPMAEYGNKAPILSEKIAFELLDSECVISYIQNGKTKYYKISNIVEKRSEAYPSVRPKR